MNLATVINYCTNDYRFISKCIEEARHFSDQIVVPVSDHFYDEMPENRLLLDHTYAAHPDCVFIEFAYSKDRLYSPFLPYTPADKEWTHLWHSTARYIGFLHLRPEIEWVLFLDCDEIAEGKRVAEWLKSGEHRLYNAQLLNAFFYVLKPNLRAKKLQQVPVLAKKEALDAHAILHKGEREGTYLAVADPKRQFVRGLGNRPLFHHYSWVKTIDECRKKARSWGHKDEFDWDCLIHETFAGSEKKFGSDHEFEMVEEIFFDPLSVAIPTQPVPYREYPHLKKVGYRDILKLELERV